MGWSAMVTLEHAPICTWRASYLTATVRLRRSRNAKNHPRLLGKGLGMLHARWLIPLNAAM